MGIDAYATVFDIDGTVCFDDRTIDPRVVSAIEAADRAGFPRSSLPRAPSVPFCRYYIAFGNDINDEDLLRHARYAVRVGDHPGLAAVAHVTVAADPAAVAAEIIRLTTLPLRSGRILRAEHPPVLDDMNK